MAEDAGLLSDMASQAAADPDAQTTVNDFLDYTEYFPSDLARSLRLISDLDGTYSKTTQLVHDLTSKYGALPTIPASDRPDPTTLRRDIASALEKAVQCRESAYVEASRLLEVAERHNRRIAIIKTKLKALPEPPSRDPTPAPVSPQASRSLNRVFGLPNFRFGADKHAPITSARGQDEKDLITPLQDRRRHSMSFSDGSDVDMRENLDPLTRPRDRKQRADRTPRLPKSSRIRIPGSGTNVHSSVAGISTSNALARLSPPPPNPRPGSRWAPWFKLTEYEMAVLRKQMKKNAVWTPSETMVRKQLESRGRDQAAYDKEKARCEATGEELLDEEPTASTSREIAAVVVNDSSAIPIQPSAAETLEDAPEIALSPTKPSSEDSQTEDELAAREDAPRPTSKRESQRRRAIHAAQELENATKKISKAADHLSMLHFGGTAAAQRRTAAQASRKRKREGSDQGSEDALSTPIKEASEHADSGIEQPAVKRLRTSSPSGDQSGNPIMTASTSTPPISEQSPTDQPTTRPTVTVQIPLAPAGPGTPKAAKIHNKAASQNPILTLRSPVAPSPIESLKSPAFPPTMTAASTRTRRESVAPKVVSPSTATAHASGKSHKGAADTAPSTALPTRPRSARGHVPTPKAMSEEPKVVDVEKANREPRRHSVFTPSAVSASGRAIRLKKPPPKGDITAGEDGQKTVTNVKRKQGKKHQKKKKLAEETQGDKVDDVDPNEPTYCVCDDISYGPMILCDNNCDREWFHLDCMNMTEADIPSRRAKWYCPSCRVQLNIDAYGNPLVPPPLPGRRGNR